MPLLTTSCILQHDEMMRVLSLSSTSTCTHKQTQSLHMHKQTNSVTTHAHTNKHSHYTCTHKHTLTNYTSNCTPTSYSIQHNLQWPWPHPTPTLHPLSHNYPSLA